MSIWRKLFGFVSKRQIEKTPPFSEFLQFGLIKIWCVAHDYEMHGWIAVTRDGNASIKIGELAGEWPVEVDEQVNIDRILKRLCTGWTHRYDAPKTKIGRICVAKGNQYIEASFDRGNINPEADEVQAFLWMAAKYLPFRIESGLVKARGNL